MLQVNSEAWEPFLDMIVRDKLAKIIKNKNLVKVLKQTSDHQIL